MKTLDELIATFKLAKEELSKAIKPGPALNYASMNPKPDRAAQEAAAPTINYGGNRTSSPTWTGAADNAAAVRSKLDAESKETAIQTINRRQMSKEQNASYQTGTNTTGAGDDMAMSEAEPHDDPKHEEKEKKKATKIKEQAQEILDLHKDESALKMEDLRCSENGQWYLKKATETVEEFKARGGKVDKVPASKKGHPKTFDAKPTKSVSGIYNTGAGGYKKGAPAVPAGMKKEESDLEKDNSVKPFGQSVYNSTANIGRKMNRTGAVEEGVGRNNAVHNYTTSGSSMSAAAEAKTAKEMKAKSKASIKTLKDMSPDEKAKLEAQYGAKIKE